MNETDISEEVVEARPTYAAAFRCIGPECEDDCCHEWEIPLDSRTYANYKQFPVQKLGRLVTEFVTINPVGVSDGLFAQINRESSGACPFFGQDRLCSVQQEYGPKLLSATCSMYPRYLSVVEGQLEGSLSLSCPEAARNVLLTPDFMSLKGDLLSGEFRTDNHFNLATDRNDLPEKRAQEYLVLRRWMIATVRDRSQPMWVRLLAIGERCRQLSGVGESIDALATEGRPQLKLEVIFDLCNALMRQGSSRRFEETFFSFVEGIGSAGAGDLGDDVSRLLEADQRYFRPFTTKYPFILENDLVNYIYKHLFPYGRTGSAFFTSRTIFQEYLQLAVRFVWISTLLIGIAGRYREQFNGDQVVFAVQSFTRAVEHYPSLLEAIDDYLLRRGLNNLEGMASLLRT